MVVSTTAYIGSALRHAFTPGIDIGIDIIPAKAGQAAYLQAWWFPHDADDITILFAIPGAPALPAPPTDTIEV